MGGSSFPPCQAQQAGRSLAAPEVLRARAHPMPLSAWALATPQRTTHNAAFRTQVHNAGSQQIVANRKATQNALETRVRNAQRRNGGCHNAARVVATQPPQRNTQRRNHPRNCSATLFGNAEPQRHGSNAGLRQRGLRADCDAGCHNVQCGLRQRGCETAKLNAK